MLIEFSVQNFRSIKDMTTLSMVASNITELEDNVFCFEKEKINLLKSSVVYGANASGKSNLIKAVAKMKQMVLTSYKREEEDGINVEPFRLNSVSKNLPSLFECVFIIDNDRWRYGFEVDKVKVQKEWLYSYPLKRERKLFEREGEKIILGSHFKEGQKFLGHIKKNALFLSTLSELKIKSAEKIVDWFKDDLAIISGLEDANYAPFTLNSFKKNPEFRDKVLNLMKIADLDINKIDINEIDISHIIEKTVPKSMLEKEEPGKNLKS